LGKTDSMGQGGDRGGEVGEKSRKLIKRKSPPPVTARGKWQAIQRTKEIRKKTANRKVEISFG